MKTSTRNRLRAQSAPVAPVAPIDIVSLTKAAHKEMLNFLSAELHATLQEVVHQCIYRAAMRAAEAFECL